MSKPNILDLYAGCGGFSVGFSNAGYTVSTLVEMDKWACETLRTNFPDAKVIEDRVENLTNYEKKKKYQVIVGGPPCQGFSIASSNRRVKGDARNEEYINFFNTSFAIKPKVIVMENVPEILKFKNRNGDNIVEEIIKLCAENGYSLSFDTVNMSGFGIPQNRKRVIFVAVEGNENFKFPTPTHSSEKDLFSIAQMNIHDAIGDLPKVSPKQYAEGTVLDYTKEPKNNFQKMLRGKSCSLHNHISMRHTDKTIEKFENIRQNKHKKTFDQNHRLIDKHKVSPTITASFYSSFIHYSQNRNLTVREAARIQTFPDTFVFKGHKTTLSKSLLKKKGILWEMHLDQFNQVGNAVPPLYAEILANQIKKYL
tara:strand:- start:6264 stop:7364 length:1101 start_codon:yes stop_codon:yes gene_type:complete